jgi:glycosyltransferase involved in cell wall biosynthesis
MKIAILSFYSGIENRGVETLVQELSKRLAKNHKVFVFQAGPNNKKQSKYKTIELSSPFRPGHSEGILRKLYLDFYSLTIFQFTLRCLPYFLREKFDIILPLSNGWQSILCKLYCLFSSSRLVFSGQSGLGWDDRLNLYLNPDVFIALTEKNKKWAQNINSNVNIVKIPNGVDLVKFSPKVKPRKIMLKKPLVIAVSALVPSKRLDLAIKAVSKLKDAGLLIIGEGYLKKDLQKLGQKLLGKNRFKIYSCFHKEVPSFLSAAQVFTLPSIPQESFGIAIVEAMATNLPVVVTNDPSRKEIVNGAGFFVNPEETDHYKEKLEEALSINWNSKPRNQAQKFSWDKISQKYEKLFSQLIAKR